ncbi:MAG: homoserine kinase [Firmicutes bacterium]|jgi:homoserine kinase|nr:homoserine kinase [Bacillota bacterium]MDH7494411.1 homoserine kinase [Bacillota bacterium]
MFVATSVEVFVPASVANLGPGFDAVGMALEIFNVVRMGTAPTGLEITVLGDDGDQPADRTNLVARSAVALFEEAGLVVPGLRIHVNQAIPVSRGLGSSAAAIVAGLVGANALAGFPLSKDALLELAVEIEGHPDNVAAALFGGFVVSVSDGNRPPCHLRLDVPGSLHVVVAIPDLHVSTELARSILPESVTLADAVHNIGRVALLVGAIACGRLDFLSAAMSDRLHQPYRANLVPGLDNVLVAATRAGALGAALSGSGPSVVAFARTNPHSVAEAMLEAFGASGVACRTVVTRVCPRGAVVVEDPEASGEEPLFGGAESCSPTDRCSSDSARASASRRW